MPDAADIELVPTQPMGGRSLPRQPAVSVQSAASVRAQNARACWERKGKRVLRDVLIFPLTLCLGGAIFSWLEYESYEQQEARLIDFLARVNGSLDRPEYEELLGWLGVDAGTMETELVALERGQLHEAYINPFDWAGATFWCFTAVTTIGYGNYTPLTESGRLLSVFFAAVGIPVCFRACAQLARWLLKHGVKRIGGRASAEQRLAGAFKTFDVRRQGRLDFVACKKVAAELGYDLGRHATARRFAELFAQCDQDGDATMDVHEFKALLETMGLDGLHKLEARMLKTHATLLALVVWAFIMAGYTLAFGLYHDDWTYLDAFYFTFDTFTTIGFGDLSIEPHPASLCFLYMATCSVAVGVTMVLVSSMTDAEFVRDVTTAWRGVRHSDTAEALQRSSTMALQRATSGKWRHSVATSTSLPTEVSVAAAITSAGTPSAASSTSGGSSGQDGHV
eukprot:Transcript_11872.p2 GENE.Transcript_11872~~Transcript_11872.p2  ORF type:complete len:471 (+),score=196.94 Transcript_11872:59-1414(+)